MKTFIKTLSLIGLTLSPFAYADTININTASSEQLESIKGIGHTKAEAIINFRNEHGQFTQIDDLIDVPGIGPKIIEQIKDQISVETPAEDS